MLDTSIFSFLHNVFKNLSILSFLTLYSIDTHQQQTAFENIVGNGEIAHNQQFLLFSQYFLLNQIIVSPFVHIFGIISLFAAEIEDAKIHISGKEFSIGIVLKRVIYSCKHIYGPVW